MQRKPVRSRQEHLEENEQVEKVAGEERAVQSHQQELEQRMEMRARRCQRASENTTAAAAIMLVSSSISADSRSTTSTIANGAGQSPSRYTPITPVGEASAAEQRDRNTDEHEGGHNTRARH